MSIWLGDKKLAGTSVKQSHNIGDIFFTSRTDIVLAGAVECNGATYQTTSYTGEGSIGELLEAGKLDYISLSAYSTAIAQTGWCDKIGWDGAGNTQFRVPTLNAHIVQTNNIPVVGNGENFVLERLSGQTGVNGVSINATTGNVQRIAAGGLDGPAAFSTDPTKSGIIADTSDTAQLRVMIQIANGATDEALETCTGVLADVAGLKDMSNITATGKEVCANMSMPSGRNIDLTLGASGVIYTAPADGYVTLIKATTNTQQYIEMATGQVFASVSSSYNGQYLYGTIPVSKGASFQIYYTADGSTIVFKFTYANGAQ